MLWLYHSLLYEGFMDAAVEHFYEIIYKGHPYGNHNRSASYAQRIRAVSKGDVLNAARKYLRPENMQTVLLGEEAF